VVVGVVPRAPSFIDDRRHPPPTPAANLAIFFDEAR
jgi:hypothetical protein